MGDRHSFTEQELELFDRYHFGQLPLEVQAELEKRLGNEPDFKYRFYAYSNLVEAVEENALREQLNEFHHDLEVDDNRTIPLWKNPKLSIAAGLAILFCLGIWFWLQKGPLGRIFEEHYTVDPGLPTVMGETKNYEFLEAMVDYKRKEYDTAILKWEALYPTKPQNDTLNYFLASALMAKGEVEDAIPYFTKTLRYKEGAFYNEAAFYQGLALIKLGRTEEARWMFSLSNDPRSNKVLASLPKK